MKLSQISYYFFSIGVCFTALTGAELESLPEFTLSNQDREQLAQVHNSFRVAMNSAQTATARKAAILSLWESKTLAPPTEPQPDAVRKAAIEATVTALLAKRRLIVYAVRDGSATEFSNILEREAVFAKSVAYMALISDPDKLAPHIPELFESRRTRSSFSRDDHFATLLIRDLASQCKSVESLSAQELASWKNLANATNAACRLAAVIGIGRVTSAVSDRISVLSETVDETEIPILSIIIDEASLLPPEVRSAFLVNFRNNNSALTASQKAQINSTLE